MRLPTTVLLTVAAIAATVLATGRGDASTDPVPGTRLVVPAGEARDALAEPFGSDLESGLPPDGLSPDGLSPDGLSPDGLAPDELGPETVPEVPDLPDGGGLVPDGPDESDTADADGPVPEEPDAGLQGLQGLHGRQEAGVSADTVFASPVDALTGGR
ncbi:hypothetical protein [Streptomyces sp. Amel2xC10]|uniref:hypothetical protein n=1 Tax=Streptomyces sp. Amel2xC10 TaxID=1305826 RepID=UPI000A085739|nr:hypothetical protein [Streptomyces sp. Amel2xC10]SME94634.1 hypothetical protein SAMN02745830_00705 [Streptomyces sp. Amel2xC10]